MAARFLRRARLAQPTGRRMQFVSSAPSSAAPFNKVLIANRGEIACRVMETCQRLGIRTVAVHSEADTHSKHVRMADEAVCIGPAPSNQSYLSIDAIIRACKLTGAEAVHPGYGFLSENRHFCRALDEAKISFIGPGDFALDVMGDKIKSKDLALKAGVNCIPGDGTVMRDEDHTVEVSRAVGYPVMVKASAGGGGKGMRVAYNDEEAREAFRLSSAESLASFGDDRLFVEKFIEEPRHIEIQVLADSHGNTLYLNERECSIQRRNQKVIEEAPSVFLDPETRAAMGKQACMLAEAVDYRSAGTVEFLVDKNRDFYFLEMNTRLQVEHPVTEEITGVDLVEQMIRVASGEELALKQSDIGINGWSIESRVYAEDPLKNFLPSIGKLRRYSEPTSEPADVQTPVPGKVRCDSGITEGSEISIHYDPMICKLITHAPTRDQAIAKMKEALDSYEIAGVTHNIAFLRDLCTHPKFLSGNLTTAFIDEEYPDGFAPAELSTDARDALIGVVSRIAFLDDLNSGVPAPGRDSDRDFVVTIGSGDDVPQHRVALTTDSLLSVDGASEDFFECNYLPGSTVVSSNFKGADYIFQVLSKSPHSYVIQHFGSKYTVTIHTPRSAELLKHMPKPFVIDETRMVISPMPGTVKAVSVKVGDTVSEGQEVCILEAMKMQNVITAKADGKVKAVLVQEGATVSPDDLLIEFE